MLPEVVHELQWHVLSKYSEQDPLEHLAVGDALLLANLCQPLINRQLLKSVQILAAEQLSLLFVAEKMLNFESLVA